MYGRPIVDFEGHIANAANKCSDAVRQFDCNSLWKHGWPTIFGGVVLSGGVYAIMLGTGLVGLEVVRALSTAPAEGLGDFLKLLIVAPFVAILALVYGAVWAGIVAAFVLPITHAFIWSMQFRVNAVWLGAIFGGLVGFVSAFPAALEFHQLFNLGKTWGVILMLAIGPGATTPLGQLGGVWGGRRVRQRSSLPRFGDAANPIEPSRMRAPGTSTRAVSRVQFGVRHLLWVAVWVSLLFTVIRLCGIPYAYVLPLLCGWVVYQAVTLWLGWLLARRLRPWWDARRQIRST